MSEELLVTTIGKLRNRLHRILKQRYAAEADVKLTIEEFILLNMIEARTDQILQNIAIATGKNKSVVMRMIDSLEQKGLAKLTPLSYAQLTTHQTLPCICSLLSTSFP